MFKYLSKILFNFINPFYHSMGEEELTIIKNTNLFNEIDATQIELLKKSAKLKKYIKNDLIIEEGTKEYALYILIRGRVDIFTYDLSNRKISLANLHKEGYFGEQIFLGNIYKRRNASVEALEEVLILKVNEGFFRQYLQKYPKVKEKLQRQGYEQTFKILSGTTGFYRNLPQTLSKITDPDIRYLGKATLIYTQGDKPDSVYLILQGKVEILMQNEDTKELTSVIYNRGHLFGKLALLSDELRKATAIAHTEVQLLRLPPATIFQDVLKNHPELNQLLETLQRIHKISTHPFVEQYLSVMPYKGQTVTSIIKMKGGLTATLQFELKQAIFSIAVNNVKSDFQTDFKETKRTISIFCKDKKIVKVTAIGDWEALPGLCYYLINRLEIDPLNLKALITLRKLKITRTTQEKKSHIICQCMLVTQQRIQDIIQEGVDNLEGISQRCGACTVCRCCKHRILDMLGLNHWFMAEMQLQQTHNNGSRSYLIQEEDKTINSWMPGEYIILKITINNLEIQRAYTISSVADSKKMRITIKREEKGYFTNWLFDKAPEKFPVQISQPQGDFLLGDVENTLCFAGGIGITPFVAFAHFFTKVKSYKKLHIVYCTLTAEDQILKEELLKTTLLNKGITIDFRNTDQRGILDDKEIMGLITKLHRPDVYICGSKGFEDAIHTILNRFNYNDTLIHTEQFLYPII